MGRTLFFQKVKDEEVTWGSIWTRSRMRNSSGFCCSATLTESEQVHCPGGYLEGSDIVLPMANWMPMATPVGQQSNCRINF
jgi:hypothetical protein